MVPMVGNPPTSSVFQTDILVLYYIGIKWYEWRESNSRIKFGKLIGYHYITLAFKIGGL